MFWKRSRAFLAYLPAGSTGGERGGRIPEGQKRKRSDQNGSNWFNNDDPRNERSLSPNRRRNWSRQECVIQLILRTIQIQKYIKSMATVTLKMKIKIVKTTDSYVEGVLVMVVVLRSSLVKMKQGIRVLNHFLKKKKKKEGRSWANSLIRIAFHCHGLWGEDRRFAVETEHILLQSVTTAFSYMSCSAAPLGEYHLSVGE